MTWTIIALFVSTVAGGLLVDIIPSLKENLRLPLIFAGSYLFAITVIHIIPEMYSISPNPKAIGLYVLIGFFLQQFLEYFSSGVEHGHFRANHAVANKGKLSIISALFVHSLLEGSLLTHHSPFHEQHESYSLLFGIILHKMPAAFALMVTMHGMGRKAFLLLLVFSVASPIGLVMGDLLSLNEESLLILFAVVCGGFLHISTTIFVESSPDHHFGLNKILISLLGAGLATLAEYFI